MKTQAEILAQRFNLSLGITGTVAMILVIILVVSLGVALADDHKREKREPNWIIERQSTYQVEGVPTSRIIVGKREVDIYPNGLMFEKGNVVGVKK